MRKERFEIGDLSGEARDRAIEAIKGSEEFYDREVDLDWLVDDLESDLEDLGLTNVEISFSGFNSQGDGASFVGHVNDMERFFKTIGISLENTFQGVKDFIEENLSVSIVRTESRYVHYNTVDLDIEFYDDPVIEVLPGRLGLEDVVINVEKYLEKEGFQKLAEEWLRAKCKEIYRTLEKAYDEEYSDESAEDWADQMGIEFNEEGEML